MWRRWEHPWEKKQVYNYSKFQLQFIWDLFVCLFTFSLLFSDIVWVMNWQCSIYRRSTEKKCWFCLSSSSVESHLLISVGESYYCALAKGPLVQNHVLLIPIDHCPNTLSMAPQVETELEQYQSALKLYFKNQGKVVVFYEWVSQRTSHANLQVSLQYYTNACYHLSWLFHPYSAYMHICMVVLRIDKLLFNIFNVNRHSVNKFYEEPIINVCETSHVRIIFVVFSWGLSLISIYFWSPESHSSQDKFFFIYRGVD